jgi:hypothetical protein
MQCSIDPLKSEAQMANKHAEKLRTATRRLLGVVTACAAFVASAPPAAADGAQPPAGGGTAGMDGGRRDRHDDAHAAYLGNAAMAPGSEFYLNNTASHIVGIVASARYPGIATVTASGTVCTQHVSGTPDNILVQVLVDNASVADGTQQYTIPASQADGSVCSPFSITAAVVPLNALSHSIWLSGQATGGATQVSNAAISAVMRR